MVQGSGDSPRGEAPLFANDIATAPGDLPMPEVDARFAALQWQLRHDNTIEPLAPVPHEPVTIWATSGSDLDLQYTALLYTTDGSFPGDDATTVPMTVERVEWDSRGGFFSRWRAVVPGQPEGTVVRYRICGQSADGTGASESPRTVWASDGQGFWFKFPGEEGITTFAFAVEGTTSPLPAWMVDAVIYHIFLDRFHPGTADGSFPAGKTATERHGGTLSGVRSQLPYLAHLGVDCLWFSPLGPAETYHRYDTIDYFGIDPALGTDDDLRDLIREAHELGMRIWLDFVPAHTSWRHPAFQAAQQNQASDTYPWFTFHEWPDRYRNFLQMSRYLPSLNADDPGARSHLIDAARYWLREFDVDGYRLDHVIAIGMDFWVALRTASEAVKGDVVLVGEATDTPDCLRRYRGKLHGILDFPLTRALRLGFGTGTWTVGQLDGFLTHYDGYMKDGPGRVSFLDNHDMDRFLWIAGNDPRRLKMAALCQFTLQATPVVYYGTEVGMTQQHGSSEVGIGGDAEARRDMMWDSGRWDHGLFEFYRALIRFRRDQPAARLGQRSCLHLDTEAGTYAYLLTSPDGKRLLVVFNLSEEERVVSVPLPAGGDAPTCLLSTGLVPALEAVEGTARITLAPMTASALRA
jgi:cyclomaltodextrinase / maltogenic alpha-amylase / neopullulanase